MKHQQEYFDDSNFVVITGEMDGQKIVRRLTMADKLERVAHEVETDRINARAQGMATPKLNLPLLYRLKHPL